MRYTKELQANVCADVKSGLTPQECAEKYNVPVNVILKWNNLEVPIQRAKEIALRKYQVEVSEAEAVLAGKLADYLPEDIGDDDFIKLENEVSRTLYSLATEIVKKERELNPHEDPPTDAEIIVGITEKWSNNQFLKKYLGGISWEFQEAKQKM